MAQSSSSTSDYFAPTFGNMNRSNPDLLWVLAGLVLLAVVWLVTRK